MSVHCGYHDSAIGRLLLAGDEAGLKLLRLDEAEPVPDGWKAVTGAFGALRRQLDEYFAGNRRSFDVRLAPEGTEFQQAVWRALLAIPYGRTEGYAGLAARIGRPRAVRAVGAAIGANPIAIVIPCHRVIGRDGALTGYAGGLARKEILLRLECWMPACSAAADPSGDSDAPRPLERGDGPGAISRGEPLGREAARARSRVRRKAAAGFA